MFDPDAVVTNLRPEMNGLISMGANALCVTVTRNVHVLLFAKESVAVQVTVVVFPTSKSDPDGWSQVTAPVQPAVPGGS